MGLSRSLNANSPSLNRGTPSRHLGKANIVDHLNCGVPAILRHVCLAVSEKANSLDHLMYGARNSNSDLVRHVSHAGLDKGDESTLAPLLPLLLTALSLRFETP